MKTTTAALATKWFKAGLQDKNINRKYPTTADIRSIAVVVFIDLWAAEWVDRGAGIDPRHFKMMRQVARESFVAAAMVATGFRVETTERAHFDFSDINA